MAAQHQPHKSIFRKSSIQYILIEGQSPWTSSPWTSLLLWKSLEMIAMGLPQYQWDNLHQPEHCRMARDELNLTNSYCLSCDFTCGLRSSALSTSLPHPSPRQPIVKEILGEGPADPPSFCSGMPDLWLPWWYLSDELRQKCCNAAKDLLRKQK